jgi:hypothetical protein
MVQDTLPSDAWTKQGSSLAQAEKCGCGKIVGLGDQPSTSLARAPEQGAIRRTSF